jgi:hypothetical protein
LFFSARDLVRMTTAGHAFVIQAAVGEVKAKDNIDARRK